MSTVILLIVSNTFMTFAWYGHLKHRSTPIVSAILLSWLIALGEYCFQVPANRIGYGHFSGYQLKIIQECITLAVFAVFAYFYLDEPVRWNYAASFVCILGAVGFAFWGKGLKRMKTIVPNLHPLVFLLIATTLEVSGDAIVRVAIYKHTGLARIVLMVIGAALLFGYGFSLNLAPLEFGQVVGLYIATLFVVWQLINLIAFRTFPSLPIVVGGVLVIAGGLIITFWRPASSI